MSKDNYRDIVPSRPVKTIATQGARSVKLTLLWSLPVLVALLTWLFYRSSGDNSSRLRASDPQTILINGRPIALGDSPEYFSWPAYTNPTLGFTLHYPPEYTIVENTAKVYSSSSAVLSLCFSPASQHLSPSSDCLYELYVLNHKPSLTSTSFFQLRRVDDNTLDETSSFRSPIVDGIESQTIHTILSDGSLIENVLVRHGDVYYIVVMRHPSSMAWVRLWSITASIKFLTTPILP